MGTRNLTVVKDFDGDVIVAQYGQWDGYPEYTGTLALNFLREEGSIARLAMGLLNCKWATEDELDKINKEFASEEGWMTMEQGKIFSEAYPSLTRDTGAGILRYIAENGDSGKEILLTNEYDFKDDSLFCEGYYEVNLHTNKFITIYGGYEVEFDLSNLPSDEDYLRSFQSDLTSVA